MHGFPEPVMKSPVCCFPWIPNCDGGENVINRSKYVVLSQCSAGKYDLRNPACIEWVPGEWKHGPAVFFVRSIFDLTAGELSKTQSSVDRWQLLSWPGGKQTDFLPEEFTVSLFLWNPVSLPGVPRASSLVWGNFTKVPLPPFFSIQMLALPLWMRQWIVKTSWRN